MAVRDHGLEVLKKAAVDIDPLNPASEYALRTIVSPGPGSSGLLITEKTAVTVPANVWTQVPLLQVNSVSTVEVFDALDSSRVITEWRIVAGGSQVEIKVNNANTYTVHTLGYAL